MAHRFCRVWGSNVGCVVDGDIEEGLKSVDPELRPKYRSFANAHSVNLRLLEGVELGRVECNKG